MKFNGNWDHPPPSSSLPMAQFWELCETAIRQNKVLTPENCMQLHDEERWMSEPFSLHPSKNLKVAETRPGWISHRQPHSPP